MKLNRYVVFVSFILALAYFFVSSISVGAVSGSGYFTGNSVSTNNPISVDKNDVLSGSRMGSNGRVGYAVPAGLTNGRAVYNWLRSEYNSSVANSRDEIGVTFIVKTMIGVPAGTSSRPVAKTVSSSEWIELEQRLANNPNIRVEYRTGDPNIYGNGRISFYGGGGSGNNGGETFFAAYAKGSSPLLIIRDTSNNTRYVLERYCANPVGNLSLQPYDDPKWEMDHASRVRQSSANSSSWANYSSGTSATVEVGQSASFIHRLTNIGNLSMGANGLSAAVQTYYTTNPTANSADASRWTSAAPGSWSPTGDLLTRNNRVITTSGTNQTYDYYMGYGGANQDRLRVPIAVSRYNATTPNYVCQRIATPRSSTDSRWRFSAPACARIVMPPWNVTGTSSRTVNNVSTGIAAPNQVIRWTHVLTLNGGINTTAILSNTGITGFSNGWNAANHGSATAAVGRPVGTIRSIPLSAADRTVYTVTQNDVGNDLCQRLQWAPTSATVGTTSTTNYACVNVPYNYNLLPSISIDTSRNGGSIEPNTPVGVDKIVNNQGPTKSRDTEWRMSQLVVRAGGSISNTGGGENINDPCVFWSGSTSCDDSDRGTGEVINPGRLSLGSTEQLVGDLDAGDKICWGLSVRAYSHNSPAGQWRHSSLVCLTVAKTPKIQFWGADARSSGQVTTARTQVGLQMYGSWAEYGIMSQSTVNSASGAMLSSGADGRPSTDDQGLNPLTFANSGGVDGVYGNYGMVPPTNLTASFTDTSTGSPISGTVYLPSLDSGEYRATGNLQLSGNVSSGKRIIIKTTGEVEITGNITYDNGPYSSLSAVPQLVISANSIAISESVNEVNGWMIANRASGSYVSTCDTVASAATWTNGLSSTVCNQPLRVNGVIVTNHLYLRRTFGADKASRHIPAETLNLRPDVYLWTSSESGNSGAISTMKIRELPPRY